MQFIHTRKFLALNLFSKIAIAGVLFFTIATKADSGDYHCSGQKECSEGAHQLGNMALVVGAMVIPHYFLKSKESIEVDSGRAAFGAGSNHISRFESEMATFVGSNEGYYLKTKSDLTFYDRKYPAEVSFGIGFGKSILLATRWFLKLEISELILKNEIADSANAASEISFVTTYFLSDNWGLEITAGNAFFAPEYRQLGLRVLGKTKRNSEVFADMAFFAGFSCIDKRKSDGSADESGNHSSSYALIGFRF